MQPLVQAAMSQIWSTPNSSNQIILQPRRLTPNGGAVGAFSILRESYTLPNKTSSFHLYQIGQIYPTLLNLFPVAQQWELVADACNQIQMVANIYTSAGVELPRTRTWYYVSEDNNIVFAVENNPRIPFSFDNDLIYIRTYRNAYFQLPAYTNVAQLVVGGGLMSGLPDITNLQQQISSILASPSYTGGLYCFVNGIKTTSINSSTVSVGDVAEFVYDSSIYKVVDFQISGLQSFQSTLDSKSKYLLHYPSGWDGQIDYQDNIDVYIIDSATQQGRYVHKNAADTLRQLTFKDYAIAAEYVNAYFSQFEDQNGNLTVGNLYLRLHVRYDGNPQVPQPDANRLHYLLKLTDAEQVAAMVGVNATVPAWNAINLEQSAYTQLLRTKYTSITLSLAEQAFGYSAANLLLCPNVQQVTNRTATVPQAVQTNGGTAYEYNAQGQLVATAYPVSVGTAVYTTANASSKQVEFIGSTGTQTLSEVYGESTPVTLVAGRNYRYYSQNLVNGVPTWQDVTGTNQYQVNNGVAQWLPVGNPNRIIRSDSTHLFYSVTLNPSDGVLRHSLQYTPNGGTATGLPVPLGELDVWLNNNALVPGIDYLFTFPTITIISKKYLVNQPGPQVLTVRMTGLCKSDLSSQKVEETGFVWNGLLSVDHNYAIHYGKSERVVVGGALQNAANVAFVENANSGSFANGTPYAVREYLNHLNGLIDLDPYTYYQTDLATDQSVSAYLYLKLGQQVQSPINPISQLYLLYSPFLCKILYALTSGNIPLSALAGNYTDSYARSLCVPYEYLLQGDPIQIDNQPDPRYTIIEPHWLNTSVALQADAYRFYANVARIYSNGLVSLTSLVSVAS